MDTLFTLNKDLFFAMHGFVLAHAWAAPIALFFSNAFGVLVVILFTLFLFLHNDAESGFSNLVTILATLLCALAVSEFIKSFGLEARPYIALTDVHPLFTDGTYTSFPSGHATFFSALAMAVYFYHKRISVVLFVMAIIIGSARVFAGVHYPLDVLSGFIIGPLVAVIVYNGYMSMLDIWSTYWHRLQKSDKPL